MTIHNANVNATCSFCGTNSHPEERLVGAATKGVYICKDCAQLCCDILCAEEEPPVEELGAKFQSAGGEKVRALIWHKCARCKGYWFDAGGETWLPGKEGQRLVAALRALERETSRSVSVDQPPGRRQLTCWTEIAREALQALEATPDKGVDYTKCAPPDYKCSGCGAHGVKLWRQYQTAADCIRLKCAECAIKNDNPIDGHAPSSASELGDDGRWKGAYGHTDKIGDLVPAVPDEEGVSFWGYTSVPQEGVDWWRRLPTHKERHGEP